MLRRSGCRCRGGESLKSFEKMRQWLREDYFSGRMMFQKVTLAITIIMSVASLAISIPLLLH